MNQPDPVHEAHDHQFEDISDAAVPAQQHLELENLNAVKLHVSADLGRCSMKIREVLELKRGSVIQLDKLAGEMTDVYVNGRFLGRGEVVVIADGICVRISELSGYEHEKEGEEEGDQVE